MKTEQFNQIVEQQCETIKKVLMKKAKEYASDDDRLYNFKAAARINNTTPLLALWGMATKHLVCVQDLITGKLKITPGVVDEKIGDLINYLILAKAEMIEEYRAKFIPEPRDYFTERDKRCLFKSPELSPDTPVTTSYIVYEGDGVETVFTVPFKFFTEEDIQIIAGDIRSIQKEDYEKHIIPQKLIYSVEAIKSEVVFFNPPAKGSYITIRRKEARKNELGI